MTTEDNTTKENEMTTLNINGVEYVRADSVTTKPTGNRAALEAAVDKLVAELVNTRQALGISQAAAKILANPSAYGLETD